jgi:hypothetical protein
VSRSLQIFVERRLDEDKLIDHLNHFLPSGAESIDVPLDEAKYFVQVQYYSNGFSLGLNISWKDDPELDINQIDLAKSIATRFSSNLLLENPDSEDEWCLVDSEGCRFSVRVVELEDGISLNNDFDKSILD